MRPIAIAASLAIGIVASTIATESPPAHAESAPPDPPTVSAPGSTVDALAPMTAVELKQDTSHEFATVRFTGKKGATVHVTTSIGTQELGEICDDGTLETAVHIAFYEINEIDFWQTLSGEESARETLTIDATEKTLATPHVDVVQADDDGFEIEIEGLPYADYSIIDSWGGETARGELNAAGSASYFVPRSDNDDNHPTGYLVHQFYGISTSTPALLPSPAHLDPDAADAPTVTIVDNEDATSTITASKTATGAKQVQVRDFYNRTLASVPIGVGSTSVTIPTRVGHSSYWVTTVDADGAESKRTAVIAREGVGSIVPEKPVVSDVTVSNGRLVATIAAEAGATLTVRDIEGTVMAVKRVGSSPATQIALPSGAGASSIYTVVQDLGSIESRPATISSSH